MKASECLLCAWTGIMSVPVEVPLGVSAAVLLQNLPSRQTSSLYSAVYYAQVSFSLWNNGSLYAARHSPNRQFPSSGIFYMLSISFADSITIQSLLRNNDMHVSACFPFCYRTLRLKPVIELRSVLPSNRTHGTDRISHGYRKSCSTSMDQTTISCLSLMTTSYSIRQHWKRLDYHSMLHRRCSPRLEVCKLR